LADFVGQIKANINTEVQMKTRDEGDLARIETKFGKGLIQSLVKSPVGSGMVQNAAYNRGNPYFIEFRPILHSVERLTDDELERYNKYNNLIDDIDFQVQQLEEQNVDAFDLRLELKLAKDKLLSGNFNMVDIYIEGLTPRIRSNFEKLGMTPKKRTIKLVNRAAIEEEMKKAKEARAEYEKANKKEEPLEKPLGPMKMSEDVPPDKILRLKNDMLVTNVKGLIDEVSAMKLEHFAFHVNAQKNDFADWIENAARNKRLAKKIREAQSKEDCVKVLEDAVAKEKAGIVESDEETKPEQHKPVQEIQPEVVQKELPLQNLLEETDRFVEQKDIDNAVQSYSKLTLAYKGLSKEDQKLISGLCLELAKAIKNLKDIQSMFNKQSDPISDFNALIASAQAELSVKNLRGAMKLYREVMEKYHGLSAEEKRQVYSKCLELQAALKESSIGVSQ